MVTAFVDTQVAGNTTSDGETQWTYDNHNRLVRAENLGGGAGPGTEVTNVRYDPLGRMYEVSYDANTTSGAGPSVRRLYYDGHDLVLEYGGNGAMMHRYVHGTSAGDDPLVAYDGSGTVITDARLLYADARGSIVAAFDRYGTMLQINAYDEFGVPDADNGGRFQYTGQQYVPELGLYYYKARMYSPRQGRFMQTDPIGRRDGCRQLGLNRAPSCDSREIMNAKVNRREAVRERIGNALALFVLVVIALLALIGPSGVLAWSDHAGQLEEYEERLAELEEERAVLQNRVDLLDPDNVDPDLASELVRRDLNVAHEDEFVVELDPLP